MNKIDLPPNWTPPKYSFGNRTKQGIIVGLENYPPDSLLVKQYGLGWRYTLLPDKAEEELIHLWEEDVKPLSPEELKAQIETEIKEYQSVLETLNNELTKLAA